MMDDDQQSLYGNFGKSRGGITSRSHQDDRYTPPPTQPMSKSRNKRNEIHPMGDQNERPHITPSPIPLAEPAMNSKSVMYHIAAEEQINGNRSPLLINDNRNSPLPFATNSPEIYHVENVTGAVPFADVEPIDRSEKSKVVTYVLDASDDADRVIRERSPSPPIRTKRKPSGSLFDDRPRNMGNSYAPVLLASPTSVTHIQVTNSRATESIERSMNKYRFLGT